MRGLNIEEYKGTAKCIFCLNRAAYDFHASIIYSKGSRSVMHPVCRKCYEDIKYHMEEELKNDNQDEH